MINEECSSGLVVQRGRNEMSPPTFLMQDCLKYNHRGFIQASSSVA